MRKRDLSGFNTKTASSTGCPKLERESAPRLAGAGQMSLSSATDQKAIALKGVKRYGQGGPQTESGRKPPPLLQARGPREAPSSSLQNVASRAEGSETAVRHRNSPRTPPFPGPPQPPRGWGLVERGRGTSRHNGLNRPGTSASSGPPRSRPEASHTH